jgi:hypothetical protein
MPPTCSSRDGLASIFQSLTIEGLPEGLVSSSSSDPRTRSRSPVSGHERLRLRKGHRMQFSDPMSSNLTFGSLRERSVQLFDVHEAKP